MLQFFRFQRILIRRAICTTSKLNGYIVLVPEIGEDNENGNAIVNSDGLPKFNNLTVENCLANIGKQAGIVEKTVKTIETKIINAKDENEIDIINDIFKPLESVTSELELTWGIAKTLYLGNSSLMPTKYYLNIHERAKRARASKFHNSIIYNFIQKISKSNLSSKFQLDEKRLIDKYLLEGNLNGLSLTEDNKIKLSTILNDLSKERTTFKNKVNTSTRQFSHIINNYSLVRNFPSELMLSVATDSNHPTKGPWKIILQPQIVNEFLKYCPDRNERWNIWQANVRKASNLIDKSLDNSVHIENIRSLRNRQAELLGYKNYVEMSMQTKMVKNVENLKLLFETLNKYAKVSSQNEIDLLQNYATKNGFDHKLQLYDIPYWKRKYLKSEYDLDEEILREYFPLPHVMNEIIKLCEDLFDIKLIERKESEVWYQTVKYYDIYDNYDNNNNNNNNNNKPIAGLYLDYYSRDNDFKNSGWMVCIRNRSENLNEIKIPLSALIFNFGTPIYGKSYLLTINDMKILLKNFGNALQHLLTRARYSDIAGLSNIEWDATSICGNVMMNLLENDDILKKLTSHYSTEESYNIDKNKNFMKIYNTYMSGYELSKELYLSNLDIDLHISKNFWLDIVKNLWKLYMPKSIELDKKNYHICSWTDIFSGDWSAAYFSNLHSKIIADDITNSFYDDNNIKKNKLLLNNNDKTTTFILMKKRFRDLFLYNDGSVNTAELFRRYRGRDPSPLPLLKRLNLLNNDNSSNSI